MPTNLPPAPTGGTTNKNNVQLPAPSNASEWAYALLLAMGIDPATHQNSLWNLTAQINFEAGSNSVPGNNPLASTQPEGSSVGGGTQGNIQQYSNWLDGLQGNISVLEQSNQKPLYDALVSNASIADYATALGKACWEGCADGAAPNIAYGQGVQDRFMAMLNGQSGGFAALSQAYQTFPSGGSTTGKLIPTPGPGVGDLPSAVGGVASTAAGSALDKLGLGGLDTIVNDLLHGFGIGWKGVLTIIGGILLIGVAVVIMLRRQVAEGAEAAAL